MLSFSIRQILGSITTNMLSSKQISIAIDLVFWIAIALYLVAWISNSNKSKKDWFWIAIWVLALVFGVYEILSDFSEPAHSSDNLPLPLASKIVIGIFFTILVFAMFKRDRTPKE
jgi:uncharacterized membrane protein HdeD (DUF308 family)